MPWHGCPPAPARPMTGDGSPMNSRTIALMSSFRPPRSHLQTPWRSVETEFRFSYQSSPWPELAGGQLMQWRNEEFDLGGVNHLALVCSDMKRTVEFYTEVLGIRLIKTINLPGGSGQHFFFDMGGGNALAFFWFPDAPDPVPGVSAPVTLPGLGEWKSAIGSMNHVAFDVPEEKFLEYPAKLKARGVTVSPALHYDDSEFGVYSGLQSGDFVRSFYFQDPDGIVLEFASWRRVMGQPGDVRHKPKTAADRAVRV